MRSRKLQVTSTPADRRMEDNRGFNLMRKMGWSGERGLGVSEQGITDPVESGEVRDRGDIYKGMKKFLGVKSVFLNDMPFRSWCTDSLIRSF